MVSCVTLNGRLSVKLQHSLTLSINSEDAKRKISILWSNESAGLRLQDCSLLTRMRRRRLVCGHPYNHVNMLSKLLKTMAVNRMHTHNKFYSNRVHKMFYLRLGFLDLQIGRRRLLVNGRAKVFPKLLEEDKGEHSMGC